MGSGNQTKVLWKRKATSPSLSPLPPSVCLSVPLSLSLQPWLAWNLQSTSGGPQLTVILLPLCLPSVRIKSMSHHPSIHLSSMCVQVHMWADALCPFMWMSKTNPRYHFIGSLLPFEAGSLAGLRFQSLLSVISLSSRLQAMLLCLVFSMRIKGRLSCAQGKGFTK